MRNRIAMGALLVVALLIAVPAFAGNGKGGGGGNSGGGSTTTTSGGGGGGGGGSASSPSSSISIASINGGVMAATTASPTTKLGDTLAFATTVQPLAGWQYPMVVVSCYQDVNGDGVVDTSLTGPDVVFTWLDKPSASFTLGGYSSIWRQRGGSAVCRAELDSYGWKSGVEYTQVLASVPSWTSAG